MKKQFITVALTAVLLTAPVFSGCGNSPQASPGTGETTDAPQADLNGAPQAGQDASNAAAQPFTGSGETSFPQNTITVNSTEKVTVTPDIAEVVYSVHTEQKDAAGCQEKNAEDVNGVIELLKGLGVAEASIQTSDYSMYPIYNYSNGTQRITGYEATTTLTVSDLAIDSLGDILKQSVQAGINNIQSITYQSSKYDESYQEALRLAVNTAHSKAQALAEAAGCTLQNAAGITENSNYGNARYSDNALASKMRSAGMADKEELSASSVDIMPGELDVEVNITVTYRIG